jgi:chromosomal replication initiation ATPase DnaA
MYEMMGNGAAERSGRNPGALASSHDAQCDAVIALVAQEKHIPIRLLMHKSRCRMGAARARQLAMYLCHVALGRSLQEVGEVFGRDRTTVSYACGLMEDMRDDRGFDDAVAALELRIETLVGAHDHGAR